MAQSIGIDAVSCKLAAQLHAIFCKLGLAHAVAAFLTCMQYFANILPAFQADISLCYAQFCKRFVSTVACSISQAFCQLGSARVQCRPEHGHGSKTYLLLIIMIIAINNNSYQ